MKIKAQILTTAQSIDRINSDLYGLSAINGRVPLVYNSDLPIQARLTALESGIPAVPELRDGHVFTPTGQDTSELYIALPDMLEYLQDPVEANLKANGNTLYIKAQDLIQVINHSGTMYVRRFNSGEYAELPGAPQSITLNAYGIFLKKI